MARPFYTEEQLDHYVKFLMSLNWPHKPSAERMRAYARSALERMESESEAWVEMDKMRTSERSRLRNAALGKKKD
jgi:hypothetical protein